jgi:hypothetical protein
MLEALTITEDEAAGLTELAAHDLAMARDFARRAQAAEDPETASDMARSYQRMARSYRQTLALKMRLGRELSREAREERSNPAPFDPRAARRRMNEVRDAVTRVAWAEAERCEGEDDDLDLMLEMLEQVVVDHAREPDFYRRPLDAAVAEACEAMGLPSDLAARWRELPNPEDLPDLTSEAEPEPARRDSG